MLVEAPRLLKTEPLQIVLLLLWCCVLLVLLVLLVNGYIILKEKLLLDGLTLAIFSLIFVGKCVFLFHVQ